MMMIMEMMMMMMMMMMIIIIIIIIIIITCRMWITLYSQEPIRTLRRQSFQILLLTD